jgi:predicted SnoaL-like aldol condensation-catalyzing enzyme
MYLLPKMLQRRSITKKKTTYSTIQMSQLEERALLMHLHKYLSKTLTLKHKYREYITDGDYVIVHLFSRMADTSNAIVDIYRVNDNGKIAEHWNVIQQIPKNSANNNTMFYLD